MAPLNNGRLDCGGATRGGREAARGCGCEVVGGWLRAGAGGGRAIRTSRQIREGAGVNTREGSRRAPGFLAVNWRQSPFTEVGLKGECTRRKSIILVQPRQVRMPLHIQVNERWLPFPQQLFTEYPFQVSECS